MLNLFLSILKSIVVTHKPQISKVLRRAEEVRRKEYLKAKNARTWVETSLVRDLEEVLAGDAKDHPDSNDADDSVAADHYVDVINDAEADEDTLELKDLMRDISMARKREVWHLEEAKTEKERRISSELKAQELRRIIAAKEA